MIAFDMEQGSPEWFALRAGKITASMFEECCRVIGGLTDQQQKYVAMLRLGESEQVARDEAGYKSKPKSSVIARALAGEEVGDFSDTAKKYAMRLAFERHYGMLLGMEDQFETAAMRRGKELEPEARLAHEDAIGTLIQHCSVVASDCENFAATADGLIEEDGVSEYKCFVAADKVFNMRVSRDLSDTVYQVQGQLWITGRKYAHTCHYHPQMSPTLLWIRVERDDEFIEKMAARLGAFNDLVETYRQQIAATQESKA